ncbi:cupredoxin family protein [Advenella sp. WQ 585]|uniref:Cupredoxin family protein n=1 Tax=Advenella mandrilli TaxID=2800330 RepID=A0ABS1EHR2_9BURK|nr:MULTISPECIES: cupredoxin family protein [Advenella]MBK1782569.1 cupredoxin family protein [Advenella mandrilli]MDD3758180.1 cupredoxin family protein [Advenella sp.]
MKKNLSVLILSALPVLALASGNHAGGHHGASGHGHDMSGHAHVSAPVGQPGDPAQVTRTIEIDMLDTMRFTPGEISVNAGETVRFIVKNAGKLPHEMVIGSLEDLKAHAVEMRHNPSMMHDEPNAITLEAGQSGSLVWKFDQSGTVDFACTIPGHMEGGMVGKMLVN